MISPSLTMTAPNGPPHPFSTLSMARRVASSMNLRWPVAALTGAAAAAFAAAGAEEALVAEAGEATAAAAPDAASVAVNVVAAARVRNARRSRWVWLQLHSGRWQFVD